MRHSDSFKSFDKTEIYYDTWKVDRKIPTFLFLHGMGGDLTAWNKERTILFNKGYGSIAVDLRGHGLSGRPQEHDAYKLDAFAKDIELLIKKQFKIPPVVIGHCFGGMAAMLLIADHPHIAKALILIDTNYKSPFYSELFLKHASLIQLLHLFMRFAPSNHIRGHIDFGKFQNTADYDMSRIVSDIAHVSLKSYLNIVDNVLTYNGQDLLKKIRIPTLIIEGLNDSVFPPKVAQELHRRIITSHLKFIPGANHILVLNNPKDLCDSINTFAQQI